MRAGEHLISGSSRQGRQARQSRLERVIRGTREKEKKTKNPPKFQDRKAWVKWVI